MDVFSDEALVQSILGGNRKHGKLLYQRHKDEMYRYFFYKINYSKDDADELLQELFLKILKGLKNFRGEVPFKIWMYRIAKNIRNDYYRRKKTKPQLGSENNDALDKVPENAESAVDPQRLVEAHERQLAVRKAVAELEPKYREPLVLHDFQGMKYEEIALVLGVPPGTVAGNINRAKKKLREELKVFLSKGEAT